MNLDQLHQGRILRGDRVDATANRERVRRKRLWWAVVLLGAQRFDPTLNDAITDFAVKGKIATITAGWQERETDDADLVEHLDGNCVNLRLHARAEEVFKADRELHEAHRARQALLRQRQDFYRIRLEHALDAEHVISQRSAPDAMLEEEERASIDAIREIDARHLDRCERDRRAFDEAIRPLERPAIQKQREELAAIVERDGRYLLVEAPYTSPLPSLNDIIFRMKLKGVTPVLRAGARRGLRHTRSDPWPGRDP